MTKTEAAQVLEIAEDHTSLGEAVHIVEYPCPGGYAVAVNVEGQDGLFYLLTEFDVNIFEPLRAIAGCPPIVRIPKESQ